MEERSTFCTQANSSLPKQIRKNIFKRLPMKIFQFISHKILVRFLLRNNLIGYGGIVHIDWVNLRGKSFLLETSHIYGIKIMQR